MPWLSLTLQVDAAAAEALSDALLQVGAHSVSFEGIEAPHWRLNALVDVHADAGAMIAEAAVIAKLPRAPHFLAARIDDEDWVRRSQAQFAPVTIGERLWVGPSWHEPPASVQATVRLDPGLAFGTGSHPSTRLVLSFLERHVRNGERVLDYGCGSGILAIAAAKLGAGHVDAVDVDAEAVQTTLDNARANHVTLRAAAPEVLEPAVYDLVVSNILAQPLIVLMHGADSPRAPSCGPHRARRPDCAVGNPRRPGGGSGCCLFPVFRGAHCAKRRRLGAHRRGAPVSLITRCRVCATAFRVQRAQLEARGGHVRCGKCGTVLDGVAGLVEEGVERFRVEPSPQLGLFDPSRHAYAGAPRADGQHASEDVPLPEFLMEPVSSSRSLLLWGLLALLAATALACQAIHRYRTEIAVVFPSARPSLAWTCRFLLCEIPLPRRPELMSIESSDLQADNRSETLIVLNAVLHNRAPFPQEYPSLELTLTDDVDRAVLRRVLAPVDYLEPARFALIRHGLAPGADAALRVSLDASRSRATGYRLYLFFPQ